MDKSACVWSSVGQNTHDTKALGGICTLRIDEKALK